VDKTTGSLSQARANQIPEAVELDTVSHQPRIVYSTIAAEDVKRLATRCYDLPRSLKCALYKRGFNDVYRLSNAERQFALRISPVNGRTCPELMAEVAVVNYIHAKGIGVALPIPRADGGWITEIAAPEGVRKAIVFDWVKGSTPKYDSESHVRQLGKLMGRVHAALDDMAPQPSLPCLGVNYLPRMSLNAICAGAVTNPDVILELTELSNRLDFRLNLVLECLSDWGLCHGDVANCNVLVDKDRCALLDFEFCGWGWRLFDLASYRLHARLEGSETQAWGPFIEEYLALRPDAESSLEHIGLFMCLRYLWLAARHAERLMEKGIASLPDRFYETLVPFCKEIESEFLGQ
jgi:Ser/Thr protein kinase RdoA (MazF antagonist)